MSLSEASTAIALAAGVSREYLLHHGVCPRALGADGTLVVAAAPDALIPEALDDLAIAYQHPITAEETPRAEVERLIAHLTAGSDTAIAVERASDEDALIADVRDVANSAPVVAYVNFLLGEALRAGASDVHLEATRAGLLVRFRLDGLLIGAPDLPRALEAAIFSRLKLMAERRIRSPGTSCLRGSSHYSPSRQTVAVGATLPRSRSIARCER